MTGHVLGFDIGGTGVRGALARITADGAEPLATRADPTPVRMGPDGVDPDEVGRAVAGVAAALLPPGRTAEAVVLGCTGAALLGAGLRHRLAATITLGRPIPTVLLCSDVLTSHIGALGTGGGVVVAAGTGAIALGSDSRGTWRRSDGWGTLLGDSGGGAWIGRTGIDAALRSHDGRPGGSPALLDALNARYGSPAALVHAVASRPDRGALLAGFARDVAVAAVADPVAYRILRTAGRHLADTLLAALPPGAPPHAAAVGNLLHAGPPLTTALTDRLTARAPHIRLLTPAGTSLDGAVTLAAAAVHQALPPGADLERLTPAAHPTTAQAA
ncbi:BadF/BadG/BcrA/BcrD ATPase family protein [Catellatospora sp. NPDC049133]|uniref:BadF/BadG/BcrA/BcrD ATPase family protein n=1 Tax=Catellatospora sp. NPDC049133 TaxID=3155499 RepID=UPI0033DCFB49